MEEGNMNNSKAKVGNIFSRVNTKQKIMGCFHMVETPVNI